VKNEKMKTAPSPCLDKALLFKGKKERDGEKKIMISPGQVLVAPKLCGLLKTKAYGASAIPSLLQNMAL